MCIHVCYDVGVKRSFAPNDAPYKGREMKFPARQLTYSKQKVGYGLLLSDSPDAHFQLRRPYDQGCRHHGHTLHALRTPFHHRSHSAASDPEDPYREDPACTHRQGPDHRRCGQSASLPDRELRGDAGFLLRRYSGMAGSDHRCASVQRLCLQGEVFVQNNHGNRSLSDRNWGRILERCIS